MKILPYTLLGAIEKGLEVLSTMVKVQGLSPKVVKETRKLRKQKVEASIALSAISILGRLGNSLFILGCTSILESGKI